MLETVPIKLFKGGVIVIEAKLHNNPTILNFLLDTGSGGISLDSSTCEELKLQSRPTDTAVSGIAGTKKVSFIFNQNLIVGKLVTEHLNFFVNDYSILSSVYGQKIDGIIGYSFFSRYIMQINFDSASLKIFSQGKFNYEVGGTMLHPTISRLMSHNLMIKDKIKMESNFYLDTGAGLCLLLTDNFLKDNNILLSRRKPVITEVQGLGGKRAMRLTVIKMLKFGPYRFRNVPTNLYNDEENVTSYPYTSGLLGNDIMRRFNITINYKEGAFYIKPNSNFNDDFDYAYTGMSLYSYDGKIIVDDIIAKSPAEKAGLQNGDEILCVANNCSSNIQTYESIIQKVKETTRLIVRRNEKLFFIDLWPVSIR